MPIRAHHFLGCLFAATLLVAQAWSPALAKQSAKDARQAHAESGANALVEVQKPIPEDARAAVADAEATGRLLYRHDRAAWLATDALFANPRMHSLKDRLAGWVTEPVPAGIRVIFYSRDDIPARLFEIDMDQDERLSEPMFESPEPLSATHLAHIKARDLAIAQDYMSCARKYNSVVLSSDDGIRVYVMPGFVEHGVYPLGGYHRFDIDATGETLLSSRSYTKGCMDHRDTRDGLPAGASPAMGMFTHLLDPQPTEIHVFVSLHARLPMMIVTTRNQRMWKVAKGEISFADAIE